MEHYFKPSEMYPIKSVAGYVAKQYPQLKDEAEEYVKTSSRILRNANAVGIKPTITRGRFHYFKGTDMYEIAKVLLKKLNEKKTDTKKKPTPIELLAVEEKEKVTIPVSDEKKEVWEIRKNELAKRLQMLRLMETEIIEELLKGE